jgi:hypothetical protein
MCIGCVRRLAGWTNEGKQHDSQHSMLRSVRWCRYNLTLLLAWASQSLPPPTASLVGPAAHHSFLRGKDAGLAVTHRYRVLGGMGDRHVGCTSLRDAPQPALDMGPVDKHPLTYAMCNHYSTCCSCLECVRRDRHEATLRATCLSCKGAIDLCIGDQDRPLRCEVFTSEGERRPVVPVVPAQPWTVRKAA